MKKIRYHINSKGNVAVCTAERGRCPYEQHFDSYDEGIAYIEKEGLSQIKKDSKIKRELYWTCASCKGEFPESQVVLLTSGTFALCRSCLAEHYVECEECGEIIKKKEYKMGFVPDRILCGKCQQGVRGTHCVYCGKVDDPGKLIEVELYGERVCNECIYKEFKECSSCGELVKNKDLLYDSASEERVCKHCKQGIDESREKSLTPEEKEKSFNMFMDTIKTLAGSQGFYARLYRDIMTFKWEDPENWEEYKQSIENQGFKEPLDVVYFLET